MSKQKVMAKIFQEAILYGNLYLRKGLTLIFRLGLH